jgi:hypothetical protein
VFQSKYKKKCFPKIFAHFTIVGSIFPTKQVEFLCKYFKSDKGEHAFYIGKIFKLNRLKNQYLVCKLWGRYQRERAHLQNNKLFFKISLNNWKNVCTSRKIKNPLKFFPIIFQFSSIFLSNFKLIVFKFFVKKNLQHVDILKSYSNKSYKQSCFSRWIILKHRVQMLRFCKWCMTNKLNMNRMFNL